ncbi:MAG: amino acid adenylation domain-containing protein [Lachnospiraceae bacterium]
MRVFTERLKDIVMQYPDKTAIVDMEGERETTYKELDELSDKIAAWIVENHVEQGSLVPVLLPRKMEFVAATIGILKAGSGFVPLSYEYPPERCSFIQSQCKASLIMQEEFIEKAKAKNLTFTPHIYHESDVALVIYTSGSTGVPKGIVHSNKALYCSADRIAKIMRLTQEDSYLSNVPYNFIAIVIDIFANLFEGVTIHIHSEKGYKDVRRIEEYVLKHQITAFFLSPQMLKIYENKSPSLRLVLTGSERLIHVCGHGYDLINVYGSSETAGSTSYFRVDKPYENTPIGKPDEGVKIYVLDADGNQVKEGETGEICITGPMANGYLELPEKTAEVFVENPFSIGEDDKILYHSGDLGKFLPDGNLLYVNRKDWMVKINGQRVETGEIEAIMNSLSYVRAGVVKNFENQYGQTYLCGYFQLFEDAKVANATAVIEAEFKKKLPEYMIPQFLVQMERLPLNINGKIDRVLLTAPDTSTFKKEYEAPVTEEENVLCAVFERILDCGIVGVNDDFFNIGGDSIKVLMVQEACSGLTSDVVFKGRTPKEIAKLWKKDEGFDWDNYREEREYYPLTDSQMGVYLECVAEPESTMYNIPFAFHAPKESGLQIEKLERALKETVLAYPVFHVVIDTTGGEISMKKQIPGEIHVQRLTAKMSELRNIKEEFVRPFDLEKGPLFCLAIVETEEAYEILVDFHHIVFDGSSAKVFGHALSAAYEGQEITKEDLDAFVLSIYDEKANDRPEYAQATQWFEETMGGLEIDSNLIPDYKDVPAKQEPAGRYSVFLQEELSDSKIEYFTKEKGITENTFFLGAFGYALAKASGSEESMFCSVNNGRHDPGFADTIGMLVRTLPLYIRCQEDLFLEEYLRNVQEGFFGAMSHDICHFGELVSKLGVSSDIMFVYQAEMLNGITVGDTFLKMENLAVGAQANLTVHVFKKQGGYEIHMEYRRNMYKEETIRRFANLFVMILKGFIVESQLKGISLIEEEEISLLDSFNQTELSFCEEETIVSLFRKAAGKFPEHTAVVAGEQTLSYRELDERSEKIAQYVHHLGLGREDVVSILVHRSVDMAAVPLGVMKAGCAYQPLDASYPKERLNFMMADARCKLLICDESLENQADEYHGKVLYVSEIDGCSIEQKYTLSEPEPEDLMILLYTSGTTGTPKGCMLTQGNLVQFCSQHQKMAKIDEHTLTAAYASFGFDANMMDMWATLTCGAGVHVIMEELRLDVIAMAEYFKENHINVAFMTTQVGRAFALNLREHPCPDLRTFLVGGETLVPMEPPKGVTLYNVYGPTETSVYVTSFAVKEKMDNFPIGTANYNTKLYIADKWNRRLPIGVPGELVIAGRGVARGYLNRPDLTEEKFTPNPFCNESGYNRIYHSGDIVRYLPDGNIEFIGRRDGQVKVRGFRIELTEVEGIIREYPQIQDATVIAKDAPTGGKMICAYIVSNQTIDISALNAFIAEQKPPYMVPAVTMQIEKIPLNVNSKVDKRALPVPEIKAEASEPPQTETQQKIFDLVKGVLGHEQFGITTDIYDAGLTSIGAVRLNVDLSDAFGKAIKIKDLKEHKTIKALEVFLLSSVGEENSTYEIQQDYPISKTQEGIFVESMANMDTTIYNIPILMKLSEEIELSRLQRALLCAIEAHPYIKTTMHMNENGDLIQKRNDKDKIEIPMIEGLDQEQLVHPFNIMGDRLFRISIHKADANYLFMEFHHIICDGTSLSLFLQDVDRAYQGETVSPETYTGFEIALEEGRLRKGNSYQQAKAYYERIFKGCDTDFLPAKDGVGGKEKTGNIRFESAEKAAVLKQYCDDNRITMNALFTAVFGFVVSKYVYKDEAVFTTIYNGRNDSRMAKTMGMFVKTLPVYCQMEKDQKIISYINDVKEQLMEAMEHDSYSFGEISREFGIKADILFAYQGEEFAFDYLGGTEVECIPLTLNTAKEPINIDVFIEHDSVIYTSEFREDMYSTQMMEGLLDAFAKTVSAFTEKTYLKEVSMLSKDAFSKLETFNDTDVEMEQVTANILLERQAAKRPDQIAVIANGVQRSFAELNADANRIANSLLEQGLKPEEMVGLMLERSVYAYAVRQGIMKAGGAFLTIDPEYPEERITYILEDSKAPYVIVSAKTAEEKKKTLHNCFAAVLILEELLKCDNPQNPVPDITPDSLAYCIYTSGSTGKPKGVMIRHRNLINYVHDHPVNTETAAYVKYATVSLALAAFTFDVSILEECIMLYNGITVCMANSEEIHNPMALSELILKNGVNVLTCTPSYIMNIVDMEEMAPALKKIALFNIGAENFPASLYEKIRKLGTEAVILNGYGPTETTIGCTLETITQGKVTIGRPMANMKMVMLDKSGNMVPPGVPGEMMILGDGVGKGYIGKPDLTAEKFVTLLDLPAYHSGDMARWNYDGKIEFMGRIDNQVKLRGLRIELDEVENVMNKFNGVNSSVVVVKGEGERQFLCGYYTAAKKLVPEELKTHMSRYLTEYMVPSVLVQLEVLPLTANGKIDKKALPEPSMSGNEKKEIHKPETRIQEQLHAIFAFALGYGDFGIDENFFELGGTSLSASKIAMKCMTEKIPVAYADVFQYPTVKELAAYAFHDNDTEQSEKEPMIQRPVGKKPVSMAIFDALSHNDLKFVDEVKKEEIGDILLTGATGFLGIHILYEYIKGYDGIAYCLVKRKSDLGARDRLKSLLFYYFEDNFEELFEKRVQIVEGDMTDETVVDQLKNVPFDTLINCAACVKHFSADDTLERINVGGVRNMIAVCKDMDRRLIQISTVSIAGENVDKKLPEYKRLKENELFFGQSINNEYIWTKFYAEEEMLLAIAEGMRGKIIRVGNLMSRARDGEFQMNSLTNGFMRMLRGYVAIGKYMISGMDSDAEFSPIDSTAQAVLKLAGTNDAFTVFHAYNSRMLQMGDVIAALNERGLPVEVVSDGEFEEALTDAMEDQEKSLMVSGLISYLSSNTEHSIALIDAQNQFTTQTLYRLGFRWPIADENYLKNAIGQLKELGFFSVEE